MDGQTTPPMYTIRSKRKGSLLVLQAIHTDTGTAFHIYETEAKTEYDATIAAKAYEKFMATGDNYLRFLTIYLADFFGVAYKGKTINEVARLIDLKIANLKEKGELREDE